MVIREVGYTQHAQWAALLIGRDREREMPHETFAVTSALDRSEALSFAVEGEYRRVVHDANERPVRDACQRVRSMRRE
jgi:hypothetical protein